MTTPLPSSKQVGVHTVRVVLLAWAMHADGEGVAWPSYERLAGATGVHARTVRSAFAALEAEGVLGRITRAGVGSRAIVRQALSAGMPAFEVIPTPVDNSGLSAGMPATNRAGSSAGSSAGQPAWKKKKKKKKENPKERFGVTGPTEDEWQQFLASTDLAMCGHKLVDDRHCTHGCSMAVN
jgi:DNA-binding transcriptional MocR family regulator